VLQVNIEVNYDSADLEYYADRELCQTIISEVVNDFKLDRTVTFYELNPNEEHGISLRKNEQLLGLYISYCWIDRIKVLKESEGYNINTLLHELAHMLQYQHYCDESVGTSAHGYYFTLAKRRIQTWYKRNYGESIRVR